MKNNVFISMIKTLTINYFRFNFTQNGVASVINTFKCVKLTLNKYVKTTLNGASLTPVGVILY